MDSSPPNFRRVPDVLRDTENIKGRPVSSPLSKALLEGQTIFITIPKKSWGSLYTLAKNHNKQLHTKHTTLNEEVGTVVWFEDLYVKETEDIL